MLFVALIWCQGFAQAGFEGAGLSLVQELDADGSSMALGLSVNPWGDSDLAQARVWAPFSVSWHFLEADGDEAALDSLDVSVLAGRTEFEDGLLTAGWSLGSLVLDDDDGILDVTPVAGMATFFLAGDLVQGGMGLDVRMRWLDPSPRSSSLTLGIPLEVTAKTPDDRPPFAHGGVSLRPGVHLWGEPEGMQWDAAARAGFGYAVVRGETVDFTLGLDYEVGARDTTARGVSVVHMFSAGAAARF
jgi:hypothetical protein